MSEEIQIVQGNLLKIADRYRESRLLGSEHDFFLMIQQDDGKEVEVVMPYRESGRRDFLLMEMRDKLLGNDVKYTKVRKVFHNCGMTNYTRTECRYEVSALESDASFFNELLS
tara:strand:- start:662 stop:1000 length:339 start_codon:yes stop_codon:yes gene_type:complete